MDLIWTMGPRLTEHDVRARFDELRATGLPGMAEVAASVAIRGHGAAVGPVDINEAVREAH